MKLNSSVYHQVGVAFDLDAVGVEDHGDVAELLVGGKGSGFAGDALFDIAFTADSPDLVVERGVFLRGFRIEQTTLETLAVGKADGGSEALAQRAGGHFDTGGQAVLGVTRGTGVSATTEVLEVVQSQAITGEVQLDVLGEGGVATGKDEAITALPVGIVRIVLDEMLVQRVGDGRQGNGGTGVAGTGVLHRVSRKGLRHLDGALVELGLLEFGRAAYPACAGRLTPSHCAYHASDGLRRYGAILACFGSLCSVSVHNSHHFAANERISTRNQ